MEFHWPENRVVEGKKRFRMVFTRYPSVNHVGRLERFRMRLCVILDGKKIQKK